MYIVGRVNHGIRREMRERLAEWNLSVQEFTALSVPDARPGLSNAQLARRALVTPQSMLEILARLEHRGLVKRKVDPAHRLILRMELTPEGRTLVAAADPSVPTIQDEMLAGVPARDREAATRAMPSALKALARDQRPSSSRTRRGRRVDRESRRAVGDRPGCGEYGGATGSRPGARFIRATRLMEICRA
jgi:DNA-binding MarR family transcriptional regulator